MSFYLKLIVTFFGVTFGGLMLMTKIASAAEYIDNDAYVVFDQVNEIRAENGLDELKWSNRIQETSDVRAEEVSRKWSHTRPNGKPWHSCDRAVLGGENLAFSNTEDTQHQVIEDWMNSPAHRDNILYGAFKTAAVSCWEEDGVTYTAIEFGYEV